MARASNRKTFQRLIEAAEIDIEAGAIFQRAAPARADVDPGRLRGMLLGIAIGDALGRPVEELPPSQRRARHGEIQVYLPTQQSGGEALGLPSDDTQLSFWTLEHLILCGGLKPAQLGRHLASGRVFGIGGTVQKALRAHATRSLPWERCGLKSAGNGALMRAAPILLPHIAAGGSDLWVDAALAGLITHNDSASLSACIGYTGLLWELLAMEEPPEPDWWLETFLDSTRDLEVEPTYRARDPRGGDRRYTGTLCGFLELALPLALEQDWSLAQACAAWGSGPYLLETLPSLLYLLMRHAAEPEVALIRAATDCEDGDTIAALAGAALGALHGDRAWPERWVQGLSGRTRDADDGRVFELIEEALAAFMPAGTSRASGRDEEPVDG